MKLWGGRFEKATDAAVDDFHSSIHFDWKLYEEDIHGSMAHARMLAKQGIITDAEGVAIVKGLESILQDIAAGKVKFSLAAEDIHMNVETLLIQRIGEAGKKLHTGRSRNDQVALDVRLYTKSAIDEITGDLVTLENLLLKLAEAHMDTMMPGYTHLQKAQPITLAHHLMAYFQMFRRDLGRLFDCKMRADEMPLGAGALAGTTYDLDREYVAQQLGFAKVTENSLDSVSDRDFVIEFLSVASLIMVHLSRFCEELVLWSTQEFSFVTMDDGYATGSSIMPQKKNPDVAELIRGKSGRIFGHLMGMLATMKGLPLAYNKDMQEDKEPLFDAHSNLHKCLTTFTGMLATITFRKDVMHRGALGGFANATDFADYLVRKGIPFRDAHEITGKAVLYCIKHEKSLLDLSMEELTDFSPRIGEDLYSAISLETCVNERKVYGGPAKVQVERAIANGKAFMAQLSVK